MKRVDVAAREDAGEVIVSIVVSTPESEDSVLGMHMPEASWRTLGRLLLDGMTTPLGTGTIRKIQDLEFFAGKPDLLRKVTYTDRSP